ncbi:glycoside hydrolase family 127 protein [Roseisalinus antarcticus]|uniref:Non-reducing end beta-L-arabinofuranosidase n=1 Tax=Roseisalinus antarcticus TaxID=254357 RepID=A0A1Y5TYH8_9RHOB|nr:beta-L-arabinofuranosidase domain-containing protein [Roseisalinus antarcticus]SLN76962.1 Non-reducing end beta-L-arabinofuranosidase [Roseisalinus antarcticus]
MNELASSAAADKLQAKAAFRPPTVNQVRVEGFFGPRIDTIATSTARILFDRCVNAGMLDQIDPERPNPGQRIPFQGTNSTVTSQMFWDSDIAKSIETAAYALYRRPDPDLEAQVDAVIDAYGRLQEDSGYCNSWYLRIQPGKRWTNLRDCHELYCAGHLMEAAVAYYHATGKRKLMDIMCRYADHIDGLFGTQEGRMRGYPGHEEIELALVKLGRATGEQRYLDLAKFFIDQRGTQPHYYDQEAGARGAQLADYHFGTYEYSQSHKPVREQREVVGHAVRAAYLYAGMADVATEFGDNSLMPALEGLWDHLTQRNLYIHGGFGPSETNEGLTFDFDLPNETAYAETCAAVALVFWASRMLGRGPDVRYGDVMERALYNCALAGLSMDGTNFFYENPLESRGDHHRWDWHHCPCCPPNISRLLASVGTYAYGIAESEVAVHLYCAGSAALEVAGKKVQISQETGYPYDGQIVLKIEPEGEAEFALSLRLPGWARGHAVTVNGETVDVAEAENGYLRIWRCWSKGDRVTLHMEMPVETVHANPLVPNNQGRIALMRGPLVYCLEEVDNGAALNSLVLAADAQFESVEVDGLTGHIAATTQAQRESYLGEGLYSRKAPVRETVHIKAVPYHAWDNREGGEMLVWVRQERG